MEVVHIRLAFVEHKTPLQHNREGGLVHSLVQVDILVPLDLMASYPVHTHLPVDNPSVLATHMEALRSLIVDRVGYMVL